MRGVSSLLGSGDMDEGLGTLKTITDDVSNYVTIACTVFLAICGLLVTLFAVYVGYKFAKATDDGQRQQAKQQLIYSIIGAVGIVLIIVIFNVILGSGGVLSPADLKDKIDGSDSETLDTVILGVYGAAQNLVTVVLQIICTVATVFAVWVGWQLMKAEDDGKRKQAKTQLLYTVIGLVAVVLINVIVSVVLEVMIDSAIAGGAID